MTVIDSDGATADTTVGIEVQSVVDMPELSVTPDLSITPDLILATDNFESGSEGWNAGTESSQGFDSGDMLGRIGGTDGEEAVSKPTIFLLMSMKSIYRSASMR